MKILEGKHVYLVFMILLAVFIVLPGCGNGNLGGGHWDKTFDPAVSSTNPVNGATAVSPGNKISATFNKEMAPATINATSFTVRHGATAVPGSVVYSGVTAVFTPTGNLSAGTLYTATISSTVKDLAGTALANDYVWSFTTSGIFDNIAPTVTDTTNHNGATGVAINSKAGATFSEAMDPATINSTTFVLRQGATVVPGSLTYSGVSAVFTPASPLAYNTIYTGTATTGAKDLGGNALASNYVWSWTTGNAPDTAAPTVSSTLPVNGSSPVAIGSRLTATFSEKMDPLSINTGTFTLKQGNTPITGTVNYSGVTAVFTPASDLAYNTTYTATITTGARDLANNPLAQNHTWSFTTGDAPYTDNIRPTVTGTINANGATGVAINTNVGATFSEAMDPLSITNLTFTLKQGTVTVPGVVSYSGVNAVFNPTNSLSANTTYTATITTGARDLYGNTLANNYVWSWTTGAAPDISRPTVTHTVNANGATGVPINTAIVATFSEAMDPLTITNVTFTFMRGLTAVPGSVSYVGLNAIFTPTDLPLPNTTYTGTITTGAKDLAGNTLSGNQAPYPAASNFIWSWTTAAAPDTLKPTITLTAPANAANGVLTNANITATFSEAMSPLSITNVTFTLKQGLNTVGGTVTYDAMANVATFDPTDLLLANTTYTATVSNVATDLAGNHLDVPVLLPRPNPWTFTTAAVVTPGQAAINLGAAGPYGVLAGTAITLGGAGVRVDGDVGISPGSTCNGCNTDTVTGTINIANAPAEAAKLALVAAYNDAIGRAVNLCTINGTLTIDPPPACGGSSNGTFAPGLYWSGTSMNIPVGGTITLDAKGDANAVFIFQSESTVNSLANSHVILANNAQAMNVFWVAKSSSTIGGTTATFYGTILALETITVNTGTNMIGRALARNGAVTVQDGALITVP